MERLETNALFLSNRNIDLAYRLKYTCRELGINVVNCESSSTLLMNCTRIYPEIIFFDLTDSSACDFGLIRSFSNFGFYFVPNIVIIVDEEISLNFAHDSNIIIIFAKSLEKELISNISSIRRSIVKYKVQKYSEQLINEAIIETLKPLCFNKKLKGYKFIKDCVKIVISNNGATESLTKMIYPSVAAINSVSIGSVERNIRTAVKSMWEYSKQDNLYNFFGEIKVSKNPTNLQMIYAVVEKALNYCMRIKEKDQHIA